MKKHTHNCGQMICDKNAKEIQQRKDSLLTYQSEWPSSKSLQAINAGEGMEKTNPLTLLVGMQTSTATMENSVEIP